MEYIKYVSYNAYSCKYVYIIIYNSIISLYCLDIAFPNGFGIFKIQMKVPLFSGQANCRWMFCETISVLIYICIPQYQLHRVMQKFQTATYLNQS